jgi:hypothetical protein
MGIRESMRESATAYLKPGETIQVVFAGQTASQYLMFVGAFWFVNHFRTFVVTPDRILVLDTGKWSAKRAQKIVAELPRSTRLGPTSGVWHVIPVGGENVRVHRMYFKDVKAADEAMSASAV